MQWRDAAIIISSRKYGESSALVRVLSREHGLFAGVVRGAASPKIRGVLQAGNGVSAVWQARLAQQLGTLKLELLEAHTAYIMNDALKLAALSSVCVLIETVFPERHPYPKLFASVHEFLQILSAGNNWLAAYISLELTILSESGFGLDLSRCAASGATEDLIYVSPKSGRAVCKEAGEPYKKKMLNLPSFLLSFCNTGTLIPHPEYKEILAGMELTGYFLEHWLLVPHNKKLPAARIRLYNLVKEYNAAKNTTARTYR